LKLAFQVVVSRDSGLAYDRASDCTDEAIASEGVRPARGDEGGAGESLTVEFVDEETFKGVGDGVDPANPFEPWVHKWTRNFTG
jgi:hypothetical protein